VKYLYSDVLDVLAIGGNVESFLAVANRFASRHLSFLTQSLILTEVVARSSFSSDLEVAYRSESFSDIRIEVEGVTFPCHKVRPPLRSFFISLSFPFPFPFPFAFLVLFFFWFFTLFHFILLFCHVILLNRQSFVREAAI